MQQQAPFGLIGNMAVIPTTKIKYVLYSRKSTESEERQILSIDSQIKEMLSLAEREGLEIIDIRRESHSAKESGQRPVFKEILEDIRIGRYNGVLTWAPDRLSRNAGDLGSLVDLMDQKLLLQIRTYGQTFSNSPNEKFLLMILCSQAKLENDNKSINVKRGLKTRVEMGLWPAPAPTGYLKEKRIDRKCQTYIDPERGHIMKQMFEKVAYEKWSGRKVYHWLKFDLNFRSVSSNKGLTLSTIHILLRNTFYYGEFEYPKNSGNWYKGSHEPLITKELFDLVQAQITRQITKTEFGSKEFAFTRLMTCGLCGSEDVREFKKETQLLKQTHPQVIHIMSVADRVGVWFVREFMTEAEQAGMLRNERGVKKEAGTQHVERVVGLWQRRNFQDAHTSVDAVRTSPEFTLLRSAFAEAGVYVTYITHDAALKDPCGMRTLYTLDR
jgi:DNA invertase Pin-like site-specific DNA recombinase